MYAFILQLITSIESPVYYITSVTLAMSDPPSKRFRIENPESISSETHDDCDKHHIGPDGVFPSEGDESDDGGHCIFPSEDSLNHSLDQTVTAVEESDDDLDSLSDSADHNEAENTTGINEELSKIGNILISECCDRYCLRHLTAIDVMNCKRELVQCKTTIDRKKWLLAQLANSSNESSNRVVQTRYFVAGKEICSSAWCRIFSVSRRTLQRMQQRIVDADRMEQHGNVGKKRLNTKTEGAIAWMEKYFDLIGDKMPDKNQIHLPCWENQKDVHNRYSTDLERRGNKEEILGVSMFYKIWRESFPNVVIPEVSCHCIYAYSYIYYSYSYVRSYVRT